tara:strand:+ start:191 stop:868 length:678 start_codon:yes stop_codon:yes gene_type:complete
MRKYKERLKMTIDIRQIAVTHIIRSGQAFGKCLRTFDEVFINKKFVTDYDLEVNDTFFAEVSETPEAEKKIHTDKGKEVSKYKIKAIYDEDSPFIELLQEYKKTGKINLNGEATSIADKKTDEKLIDWDKAILKILKDGDNFMTTRNVLNELQGEYRLDCGGRDIGNKLSGLHKAGKVARLALHIDGSNKRVSEVCWCISDIASELYKNNVFGIFEDEEDNVHHL